MRLYTVHFSEDFRICFGSADAGDITENLKGNLKDVESFRTNSFGNHWNKYPVDLDWFFTKEHLFAKMNKKLKEKLESYIAYETIILENE